jgi:DNA-binding transcriptional ArsR family regulator
MLREDPSSLWISGVTHALRVLGHETRLRLVLLLAHQMPGDSCRVDELTRILGAPTGVVSLHLGVLENAGIVRRERRDDPACYFLDRKTLLAYGNLVCDLLAKGPYVLA